MAPLCLVDPVTGGEATVMVMAGVANLVEAADALDVAADSLAGAGDLEAAQLAGSAGLRAAVVALVIDAALRSRPATRGSRCASCNRYLPVEARP